MAGTLLIRADAAPEIGAGHVMRCLALSQAWKERGGDTVFLGRCEAPALRERLAREGFRHLPVAGAHPDPADLAATLAAVRDTGASWVILDGYGFDPGFQRGIKESGARVLVLDDYRHLPEYHADLVLNQSIGAEAFDYGLGQGGQALLGCRYVLLRSEFLNAGQSGKRPADAPLRVLVTLGGADAGNVTGMVLEALASLSPRDFLVRAVAGPANPNVARLKEQAAGLGDFVTIVEGADMPAEMAGADFAVTAAGSTCWELLYLGVPLACLVLADNQAGIAAGLGRAGAALSLGRAEAISGREVAARVELLLRDAARRAAMSRAGQGLVDGRGARRVVERMRPTRLTLRPVSDADCRTIWELGNDTEVRAMSFHSEPIPWETHQAWFKARLADPAHLFFLAEDESGNPAGQVRFQDGVISVSLARDFRGLGLGAALIGLGCAAYAKNHPGAAVMARIRKENAASVRSFRKAGFRPADPEAADSLTMTFGGQNP